MPFVDLDGPKSPDFGVTLDLNQLVVDWKDWRWTLSGAPTDVDFAYCIDDASGEWIHASCYLRSYSKPTRIITAVQVIRRHADGTGFRYRLCDEKTTLGVSHARFDQPRTVRQRRESQDLRADLVEVVTGYTPGDHLIRCLDDAGWSDLIALVSQGKAYELYQPK